MKFLSVAVYAPIFTLIPWLGTLLFYICLSNRLLVLLYLAFGISVAWYLVSKRNWRVDGFLPYVMAAVSMFVFLLLLTNFGLYKSEVQERQSESNLIIGKVAEILHRESIEYYATYDHYYGVCDLPSIITFKQQNLTKRAPCYGPILALWYGDSIVDSGSLVCEVGKDNFLVEERLPHDDTYFCIDKSGAYVNEERVENTINCR